MTCVADLITRLGLRPHPEGGYYAETFRSALPVATPQGARAASTGIYFLLAWGEVSRWHSVRSDELWHWYEGDELELLVCDRPGGEVKRQRLGPVGEGVRPQLAVAAGWWQAARPLGAYALAGCTVAPGFDFADFTLLDPRAWEAAWFRQQADPRLVDG